MQPSAVETILSDICRKCQNSKNVTLVHMDSTEITFQ